MELTSQKVSIQENVNLKLHQRMKYTLKVIRIKKRCKKLQSNGKKVVPLAGKNFIKVGKRSEFHCQHTHLQRRSFGQLCLKQKMYQKMYRKVNLKKLRQHQLKLEM